MRHRGKRSAIALTALLAFANSSHAKDVIVTRAMSLELAMDIAKGAVDACRKDGYQVAAVVVDRSGSVQVTLRDVHASRFNTELAFKKANASILSAVASSEFRRNRGDVRQTMDNLDEVLILEGALPIRAAGSMIGAVGVSGAAGGKADEACAAKGLEKVQERLDFAD